LFQARFEYLEWLLVEKRRRASLDRLAGVIELQVALPEVRMGLVPVPAESEPALWLTPLDDVVLVLDRARRP
jgi:hypothetical protein